MGMLHLLQELKEGAEDQRKHRGACALTGGRRERGMFRTGEFYESEENWFYITK